ncbi:MAG TPA: exodeoxyribonuclease VII large subunit, partial [Terriglobales bacterium]
MSRDAQGQLGLTFNAPTPDPVAEPSAPVEPAPTTPTRAEKAVPPPDERSQTAPAAPPLRKIWTVRELVSIIRGRLEREFSDVWFEGEISNYRPAGSGHLYFSIADGDAQIKIVMFRSSARLLRFQPENGMHIIGRGRVTLYDQRGELQINAEYLEPKGAGALQVAFEQLKAKLAAEGLFDAARKRPLSKLPRRIGIVTSPRGAAIQDMLNVLRRRHENVHILIYPAQVQGELARLEVAAGIRYFNMHANVDVVIVARGGGSVEDLAAFNDEML